MSFSFGGLGSNTAQTERRTGTLFGSSTAPAGGLFGQSQQQQNTSTPSLFGASTNAPQPNTGIFGASQQQQPQNTGGGLFGNTQQNANPGVFGQSQQQPPQQQNFSNSLFGGLVLPAPSLSEHQQQALKQSTSGLPQLGKSLGASYASNYVPGSREKSVIEQMKIVYEKWEPRSPDCAFQTYLYNSVGPELAPFYGPPAHEDDRKWDEALSNKPSAGTIPILVRGFEDVAARIQIQQKAVGALQFRLHEMNNVLEGIKNRHELDIASRITEAKQKHIVNTQRILTLATKIQILRNRGYVMDQAEEELKKKLLELEKKTFDPVLGGRQEEIWARMSSVRERARILQEETEKVGKVVESQQNGEVLSEEDQKALEKLLKDYDRQLEHLKKWVDDTKDEYEEWDKEKKTKKTVKTGR